MAQAWFHLGKTQLCLFKPCKGNQVFGFSAVFCLGRFCVCGFVGLVFSFSEDLSFKLVVHSPTGQLGHPKPNVTVYSTILDQNRKGFTNCVLGVCCLIQWERRPVCKCSAFKWMCLLLLLGPMEKVLITYHPFGLVSIESFVIHFLSVTVVFPS